MSIAKHINSMKHAALVGALLAVTALLNGCGESPSSQNTSENKAASQSPASPAPVVKPIEKQAVKVIKPQPAKTAPAQTPATPAPAPAVAEPPHPADSRSASQSKLDDDWFEWYAARTKYLKSGRKDDSREKELALRAKELAQKEPPKSIGGQLELLAFNMSVQDNSNSKNADNRVETVFSYLFRKSAPTKLTSTQEPWLMLRLLVDKAHERYFSDSKHPSYVELRTFPHPTIQEWKVGEYQLVTIKARLPLIPYHVITFVSLIENNKNISRLGGKTAAESDLDLGWRAAITP